jgi:transposase
MAKYSRSLKIALAQKCLNGTPATQLSREHGISKSQIQYWRDLYHINGDQSFLAPKKCYTANNKADILNCMWSEGWSIRYTAAFYNLPSPGTLWVWLQAFDQHGLSALQPKRKGRSAMAKYQAPTLDKSIDEMTPDELRRELEYRRAEVAVLKKLEALAESKRRAARKKRKSSKS